MVATVAVAVRAAVGCGDEESAGPGTGTGTGTGTATGTGAGTGQGAPAWTEVPDQIWTVGQPVELDLAQYCTDPDGDPLTFSLDQELPPGLVLDGSVIRGTPTAEFAAAPFTATADDGQA